MPRDRLREWNVKESGCDEVIEALALPSLEGAKLFDNESIAFVFLDGDHSYEAVHAGQRNTGQRLPGVCGGAGNGQVLPVLPGNGQHPAEVSS